MYGMNLNLCVLHMFEGTFLFDAAHFCTTGNIRLEGGRTPMDGRLEVFRQGEWGTVCKNGFDVKDAAVICRSLGYT